MPQFPDQVEVIDAASNIIIRLDANTGDIRLGGDGTHGRLQVLDASGTVRLEIEADKSRFRFRTQDGAQAATLTHQFLYLGGPTDGYIKVTNKDDDTRFLASASNGRCVVGGPGKNGRLYVHSGEPGSDYHDSILMEGSTGFVRLRGQGQDRIRMEGHGGDVHVGGNGAHGDVVIFPEGGDNKTTARSTIHLQGSQGNIFAGGNDTDGDVALFPGEARDNHDLDQATIHLNAQAPWISLSRGPQRSGRAGGTTVLIDGQDGNILAGGPGVDGDVVLFPADADTSDWANATIHLNAQAGDIILRNADCAEDFDVAEEIPPGCVAVLDAEGRLRRSTQAYDPAVAGVVSGAGSLKPGIVLDRQADAGARSPIALVGKVFCRVEADSAPIDVGSLLTTSYEPGHAMRAMDPARSFGAVIGKALRPVAGGRALIPILVALQ